MVARYCREPSSRLAAAISRRRFWIPGHTAFELALLAALIAIWSLPHIIYVRFSGSGPAVVLLHGYGETGDIWVPMAADLVRDHTVAVPDLRALALSSKPPGGFDKKTQASDVAAVLSDLKIEHATLVTHDIGNMVGYAFAALYPERVARLALIDAPIPGIGHRSQLAGGARRTAG